MLIPLILTVAVANLFAGYLLSVYYYRPGAAPAALLPGWSDGDAAVPTVPHAPAPPTSQLASAPKPGNDSGLPQQWLDVVEGLASTNGFVEASMPVLMLEVGAYRDRLVELDIQVRALQQGIPGNDKSTGPSKDESNAAVDLEHVGVNDGSKGEAAAETNDTIAALQAIASSVNEANTCWLEVQKRAADHLRKSQHLLGDFSRYGEELEQALLAQAAQVETTTNNLGSFTQQCDAKTAARRLLAEIARLLDHCHNLRDSMQASLIEVLHFENRLPELDGQTLLDRQSGLSNRGGLQKFLDEFRQADTEAKRSVSFGWVEIDQLRSVNEQYGPQLGDRLVETLGQLISSVLRTERGFDLGCRVTGNGFAAFLGDTAPRNATIAVERVRQTASGSTWLIDGKPLEITLSCSVIDIHAKDSLADLVARSRSACHYARSAGGNQTWLDEGRGPLAVQAHEVNITAATFTLRPSEGA